jgi:DNA modification methylase
MNIEKIQINKLKPATYNPRQITTKQYKHLKESVEKFGLVDPIITNKDFTIIGGHQRYKICKELKHKEIDCVVLDLSKEEERELNIRLNKNTGDFDMDILANEFDIDELVDWGFKHIDLDINIDKITEGNTEDDYIPEVKESRVKLGDVWELGKHRLMCGDSTKESDVDKLMNGQKADMVFTDPPYGVNYEGGHNKEKRKKIKNDKLEGDDLSDLFKNSIITSFIYTKDTCPFYIWFASGKSIETFKGLSETGISVRAIICWYKIKSGLGAFMAQYIPNYEPCIYGHKEGKSIKWYGATDEKTVWELQNDNKNRLHPTQKPIALVERAINNSSQANDILLDLFLGSGSTLIACEKTNRICYGMELDTKYCDVIIERWEQFTGQKATKL